ncbi:hypothetical protein NDU88_001940 [Pleurodeles waltl]|uniref:Uncharacterized protein n=1 Tax=Pleurodeles waltl TaxID=8319 RepID=A0AAV7MN57_PLEWA|nr:hypothetical protein NDU88_001940 [Pleurodeles waltl]
MARLLLEATVNMQHLLVRSGPRKRGFTEAPRPDTQWQEYLQDVAEEHKETPLLSLQEVIITQIEVGQCDGPTLWSDPSYPWGTDSTGIPDPDVGRAGTTQQTLPDDDRQQQLLRAITSVEKDGEGDYRRKEVEEESGRGDQDGEAYSEGGDSGGRTGGSSPVEVLPSDAQGRSRDHQHRGISRGPGGSVPGLRPRSGESMASAGAWTGRTRRREVEGE